MYILFIDFFFFFFEGRLIGILESRNTIFYSCFYPNYIGNLESI